jgi:hypothetical protein
VAVVPEQKLAALKQESRELKGDLCQHRPKRQSQIAEAEALVGVSGLSFIPLPFAF